MAYLKSIENIIINRITIFFIISTATLLMACSDGGDSGGSGAAGDGFSVTGQVSNLNNSPTGVVIAADTVSANYVYAVNIGSRVYLERKKTPINQDGTFSITLTKGESWILAFIDSSKVGFDMVQGIFKADQLDAIAPKQSSSRSGSNVGNLTIDEFGDAKLPVDRYVTYIGDLGLTMTEASELATMDDFSLRYMNPDVDANGIIDIDEQNGVDFALTSWQDYLYDFGNEELLLASYVRTGQELPVNKTVTYRGGAGPKLSIKLMESGVFSAIPGKWSLTWTNGGNYTGSNSVTWTENITDVIGASIDNGYINYGVGFPDSVTDIPDGTYTYQFYENVGDAMSAKTLTILPVKTMDDASNITNFIFPFPVFYVDGNDDIASVSYKMMKWEAGGFVPATSSEIELYIGKGEISIGWGSATGGKSVSFDSSNLNYETSGTIDLVNSPEPWIVTVKSNGNPVKRSEITALNMSFVSRHGIWTEININPLLQIIN